MIRHPLPSKHEQETCLICRLFGTCDVVKEERKAARDLKRQIKDLKREDPEAWALWTSHGRKYGLSPDAYFSLYESQDYRCAICGYAPTDEERSLAIDHDHETGEVRGLLCSRCNIGLGYFKDDPKALMQAVSYLTGVDLDVVRRLFLSPPAFFSAES